VADNSIVRRSWLIVPAHDAKAVEQAQESLPDVLVLDLEYTVPPKYKEAARSALYSTISNPAPRASEVFVRVDRETRWCDIEAAVCPGLKGIVLPGPESAEEVAELDRLIGDVEHKKGVIPDTVELVLILESPQGFWNAWALAGSSRRVTGLGIGRADLTMSLGPDPDGEFHLYPYLMSTIVTTARGHNIQAIGAHWRKGSRGGVASPKDTCEACRRAWLQGFTGSLCARPEQVMPMNDGFTPPQAEVKKTEKIWAAFQRRKQAGQHRVEVGGRYYDARKAGRCQDIVLWAQCCARRDEDKKISIRVEGKQ
jgi:citrate lyase beta subunit